MKPAFRTPVRTRTKLHPGTDGSSSECTTRQPQPSDDSSRGSEKYRLTRHRLDDVLHASGTALRRAPSAGGRCPETSERAETQVRLRATDEGSGSIARSSRAE